MFRTHEDGSYNTGRGELLALLRGEADRTSRSTQDQGSEIRSTQPLFPRTCAQACIDQHSPYYSHPHQGPVATVVVSTYEKSPFSERLPSVSHDGNGSSRKKLPYCATYSACGPYTTILQRARRISTCSCVRSFLHPFRKTWVHH